MTIIVERYTRDNLFNLFKVHPFSSYLKLVHLVYNAIITEEKRGSGEFKHDQPNNSYYLDSPIHII